MFDLAGLGFRVREVWLGDYFDGLSATKRIGVETVEIYCGGADNGESTDLHHLPVVYLGDKCLASDITVAVAARVAEMRVLMGRAAIAKAEGGAA